jgi:predicted membrane protein
MEHEKRTDKRAYFGVFLILLGVVWILERLDLIPVFVDDILISWQMVVIAIGVFALLGGNRTTGVVLIFIGGVFLIPEMIHIPYELRRIVWPLLLVGVGIILLIRHLGRRDEPVLLQGDQNRGIDYFDDFIIFGGREIFVTSTHLLGGKTTSIFGGTEYDMRRASLSPNGAVVDCLCLFGGCTFKVPPEWTIKNEMHSAFGGLTDKRGVGYHPNQTADPSKIFVLKGFAAFGGVEIKLM